MSKLLGYCRVSTSEQAQHGYSLGAQRERLASYCAAYGHTLIDVHASEGVSGSVPIAKRLAPVIERLGRGEADGLIFAKLDRLSRTTRDLLAFVETVERKSWLLVSIGEHIDTSTANGRFALTVLVALAQLERERTSERIIEVMQSKRARGERVGRFAPLGSQLDKPGKGGQLSLNTRELAAASFVFRMRNHGTPLRVIADRLREAGFKTRSGGLRWSPASVKRLYSFAMSRRSLTSESLPQQD